MVTPGAEWLEVERLDHNRGKIHDVPLVRFRVRRFEADGRTVRSEEILEVEGRRLRKEGLGKDVTDKFLARPARACRRRAATASSRRRPSSCTACPRTRAPCAWSSSAT